MRLIMPSIATHYLFGQDLLNRLDHSEQDTLAKSMGAFRLGLQGPDIFLYDLIHTKIAKDMNFGEIMHTKRTDIFFFHYIEYLKTNKLCDNATAIAYFYGMLCHYSLDSTAHPYIYYSTNLYGNSPEGQAKSLFAHRQFETDLDELLYYDRTKKSICNINRASFMDITPIEIAVICPILAYAISETYKSDVSAAYIKGAIKRCLKLNSILNDNFGNKKKLTKHISGNEMIYTRKLPSRKCLNEKHELWLVPIDGEIMQSSFLDLYNHGLATAVRLIAMAHDTMNNQCELSKFITATGGKSYTTGVNWRIDDEMSYFKSSI